MIRRDILKIMGCTVLCRVDLVAANPFSSELVCGSGKSFYTNIKSIDNELGKINSGELVLITSKPSVDKTALATTMMLNMAVEQNTKVLYFSLGMKEEHVMIRLLSQHSGAHLSDVRILNLDNKRWAGLISSAETISKSKIFLDDSPHKRVSDIERKIRKCKKSNDLDVVFVDSINYLDDDNISKLKELKGIAQTHNLSIVVTNKYIGLHTKNLEKPSGLLNQSSFLQADKIIHLDRKFKFRENTLQTNVKVSGRIMGADGSRKKPFNTVMNRNTLKFT